MWHGMGWWNGEWGVFGMIMMILWWAFIVVVIAALAKWAFGRNVGGGSSEDRALSILRERYARGEIDKAEFEARKRDLE